MFLKAAFTLNTRGLGFRKYLLARRLANEIVAAENQMMTPQDIENYQHYNDHLEYLERNRPFVSYRENWTPLTRRKLVRYTEEYNSNASKLGKILRPD